MAQLNTRIVLRNDSTANWLTNNQQVLMKGEVGIEFLEDGAVKIKIGDGVKTWDELAYFGGESSGTGAVYKASSLEELPTTDVNIGDIGIVTSTIGGDKTSYTAYVYTEEGWAAMDGNYSAENVYFNEDFTYTADIGVLTVPSSGSGTIAATGKNVKELLSSILAKEANPTTTQPSVTVSCPQAKAYEVGTSVTPTYTATLKPGSYTYGPATGITATSWNVSNGTDTLTTATGTYDAIVVGDSTSYVITATATYEAGAVPVTNIGNSYAAGQIAAGSKTGTSGRITGYRNSFYGTLTTKDGEINSALVRSLPTKSNKALANGNSFTISIPVGAIRVVFAYPATLRDVSSVQDVNGMNAEIKTAFTRSVVSVEGADGYSGIDYKVYVMDMANANDTANSYKVTI